MQDDGYAKHIGFHVEYTGDGSGSGELEVQDIHLNPNGVVHGGAIFSLADTTMGAALFSSLADGEICATIQINISYFKPVMAGRLTCEAKVINRGKRVANMQALVFLDGVKVASADANFAIFSPKS